MANQEWHPFMHPPKGELKRIVEDLNEKEIWDTHEDPLRTIRIKDAEGQESWGWYEPIEEAYHVSLERPQAGQSAPNETLIHRSVAGWMWSEA